MSRTVPAALLTYLQSQGKQGVPALITLRLRNTNGTFAIQRITSHGSDLNNGSNTFTSTGLNVSPIDIGVNERPQSGEFTVSLTNSSPVTADAVERGDYYGGKYEIAICDPDDAANTFLTLVKGRIGPVEMDSNELFAVFQLEGTFSATRQGLGIERSTPTCRAIIGDNRCRLPVLPGTGITHITERADSTAYAVGDYIRVQQSGSWDNRNYLCTTAGTSDASQPTFDTTVGNTTTDGTAVFTAEQALAREATIVSQSNQKITVTVTEARAVDNSWFRHGICVFNGGANDGEDAIEIVNWNNSSQIITLANAPPFEVTAGEKLFLIPGDDKTASTCASKFSHILNFVGEAYTSPYAQISFVNSL